MMRFNRLGIKIFVSFVLILAMIGLLVFGLFRSSQDYEPGYQNMAKNAMIIKLILEETGRNNVPKTLNAIGRSGRIMAWVTNDKGKTVASSIDGDIPPEALHLEHSRSWGINEVTLYQIHKGETEAVAAVPMILSGKEYTLYLSNRLRDRDAPELLFLRGLAPVLLAGVVLMFLLTWFIARPLRSLHNAVSNMALGDLSTRVQVNANDELGDLSRAFNRMAGSLERMIRGSRELMSNVSHQLRTPLTRMRLSLELLRDDLERRKTRSEPSAPLPVGRAKDSADAGDDIITRHIGLLQGEIDRMDGLIGQILLFSRLDLKEHPLQLSPCRVASLLAEVAQSFAQVLNARDLSLTSNIEELPVVRMDVDALTVALENILDNAVKYAAPGGQVVVRAKLAAPEPATSKKNDKQNLADLRLRLEICNTAPPMTPEELEGVLKPFYRGGQKAAPGSGLGLPISKKIIEGHSGKLIITNDAPGFCVVIELPQKTPGHESPQA